MPLQDNAELLLQRLYNEGPGNAETQNSGTAITVSDSSLFSTTVLTLNGATPAVKLPVPRIGAIKRLYLIQDGTGSRIPVWSAVTGAVKWVGAAAPTLQTAAGKVDRVTFESYDGVNWVGSASLNIA